MQTASPATDPESTSGGQDAGFVKGLGLLSATTLVMGSMIGSGIFIVSADIARLVQSPALLVAAWLVTGFMTVVGALCYGELAAMMPRAGGQYVYLREGLGRIWGFLYGWTLFLVIQTGTIAAVAMAFGKFMGVFFPEHINANAWLRHIGHVPAIHVGPMVLGNMDVGLHTQNLVAVLVVVTLTLVNLFGVKVGAIIQNIFTVAKTAAVLGLIVAGALIGWNHEAVAANYGHFWVNVSWSAVFSAGYEKGVAVGPWVGVLTILAVAQVGSLFSADAWNNVTFTAGEVRNPQRNLPLSLAVGTGAVILLYVLANLVYLAVLPLVGDINASTVFGRGIQYATDERVGTAVMQQVFGANGARMMAFAVLVSTFGCCNGLILAGARVYYAMARDGLFFASAGNLHPTCHTPVVSLLVQMVWTCFLCLSGSYGQLLDYIMFAVLVFYILTIVALFRLRATRPDAERPYRAVGYPVLPAVYIMMATFIDLVLLRYKPQYTWPGLIIVILGIPVYYLWSRRQGNADEPSS